MIVWPGLRRSVSAISRLFNSAAFDAPLTHSAIPTRAASGTTATFTRATTATVRDHEGVLRTLIAGEIGFVGARRVRNVMRKSEDFSGAEFTKTNCTVAKNLEGPDGVANSACTVTATGASALLYDTQGITPASCTKAVTSVYLKRITGTGTVQISANGANTNVTVALTTSWQRFEASATTLVSGTFPAILIATSGDAIGVAFWQEEDVTAQTTQTAGEYVSVGVESAPYYHGSFVDGVRCFPTDLSGNPIPSTTLLGYQAQGARTNYQPNSNAFTTTWSKTAGVTLTQNAVDDDGATTAWTAAITGAGQNITYGTTGVAANQICALSINLWPITAGTTRLSVYNTTGGANFYADCNPTDGTITTSAAGGTVIASGSIPIAGGGYRFWIAGTTNGTSGQVNNPVVYYGNGVSVKQSKVQFEIGSFASSYIATTTVAVTRNADVESVSTSGNIAAAAGSIYLEYTPTHTPSGTIALWGTYVDASNYTAILHDATNLIFRKRIAGVNYDATIANAFVAGTTYKACATWGAAGTSITLNGTEGTPHANTTAAQIAATMQWGADGNSLQQPFASIRNCRDWLRQLSASERAAVTA